MDTVTVNRAPVLTLWAAVVAERLGFDREEALTLGKAVAGLTAQSKGQRLGIFTPSPDAVRRQRAEKARATGVFHVALLGRAVPVLHTDEGLRAAPVTVPAADPVRPAPTRRRASIHWARLLARIYETRPLTCPRCHGEMRLIAFLTEPASANRPPRQRSLRAPAPPPYSTPGSPARSISPRSGTRPPQRPSRASTSIRP